MKRILYVLTVALILAAITAATSMPAFAQHNNTHVCQGSSCDVDGDNNTTNFNVGGGDVTVGDGGCTPVPFPPGCI